MRCNCKIINLKSAAILRAALFLINLSPLSQNRDFGDGSEMSHFWDISEPSLVSHEGVSEPTVAREQEDLAAGRDAADQGDAGL